MTRLLRALVREGDEGAIEGDLLEEYTEEVRPRSGALQANVWYLRQALSLVRFSPHAAAGGFAWIGCGAYLWFAAMSSGAVWEYGLSSVAAWAILGAEIAVVLNAMGALRSIRWAALWRSSLVFGVPIGLLLGTRFVLDAVGGLGSFASFATLGRDIDIGQACLGLLVAAGIWGGWRWGQFRGAALVACSAGAIGWLVSLVAIAGVALRFPGEATLVFIRNEDVFGIAREFVRAAAVFGTIGGMLARGLRGFAPDRRQIARAR